MRRPQKSFVVYKILQSLVVFARSSFQKVHEKTSKKQCWSINITIFYSVNLYILNHYFQILQECIHDIAHDFVQFQKVYTVCFHQKNEKKKKGGPIAY